MILYLETNYILSVATGRDGNAGKVLERSTSDFRIVLPSICIMEAFSAFEDERKRRGRLNNTLDEQIGQAKRDLTSVHAKPFLASLQDAVIHHSNLTNDVERRLYETVQILLTRAEVIHTTPAVARQVISQRIMKDPTDDLILRTILADASGESDTKVVLSENTQDFRDPEVQMALKLAGVRYFPIAGHFLGWFDDLSRNAAAP